MPQHLVASIMSKVWMIEQNYVQSHIPLIANLLNGNGVVLADDKNNAEARAKLRPIIIGMGVESRGNQTPISGAAPGSIAVVNLTGALMKQDQWCGPEGTATIGGYIKEADNNPNISAIILRIDSPGGTVDGTETLANTVKNTKKPIVAFVDGMAASAAYWIASACDEIIASSNTDIIGSIGTQISFLDILPALEKNGIKFHEVQSDQSYNKNIEFREALKGNYKPLRENLLNPTNKVFISSVKKNRSGKIDSENEEPFTGTIYLPKQALKAGLIDHIGDFSFAIERATELSRNNSSTTDYTMKINVQAGWAALKSFLGISAEEQNDVQHELTSEQLEQINAQIGKTNDLEAENQRITEANNQLTEKNNDLTAKVQTLTDRVAELEKEPATHTAVLTEEERISASQPKVVNSWEEKANKKVSY